MPAKTKSSTAKQSAKLGPGGTEPLDEFDNEMDIQQKATASNVDETTRELPVEPIDNRSLEEILAGISPPPPPAMTNEPGAPRLMITHIVNQNFKSYAGEQILGPFHKRFSCIIGPNGSGKSNVIDSMLFVFGYRAQKIRSKKLSVLIHNSDEHKDIQSCTVEVHFQKIIDKEGDDFEVIPNSNFCVSRTAYKDNSSTYHINGKKSTFKDVGVLLRSHGIDLDHNRFLILQGEVEQIAMMKPKGQNEHSEGMLEYLEDIIGSERLKEPIQILCRRVEILNEQRGEKLNRVKMVEKEKDALEGERNHAIEFLILKNEIVKNRNCVLQYYIHDVQKRIADLGAQKQKIHEDTQDTRDRSAKLVEDIKIKNNDLKHLEKKLGKITKFIEEKKEEFAQFDLQDVKVREKLKHSKSKEKKLQKQLQKDIEKLEELKNIPGDSEDTIRDATARREELEQNKVKEEEKLRKVMDSLKQETKGLQEDKEMKEEELMELSKAVNESRSKMDVAQSELDIYLSHHKSALDQLNQAKEALATNINTLKERKATIKDVETKIPQCEQELQKDEKELEKVIQSEAQIRNNVYELRQKVEEAKSSLTVNRSRGRVLEAVMQQKNTDKIPGIYGRLGDLGAIEEKYDVAISSSCGALDNIVVDTIDTAQECVKFLKKQNIGVATFICLDKMKVWERNMGRIQTPEKVPRLFDMVKIKDEAIRPAFYFALRDTLVAKDLEQATRVAFQKDKRWRVVTIEGQIIEQSGTMTGGGGRVMKGRMGSSLVAEITPEEGLTEQQVHLAIQVKDFEVNVATAAPDQNKQKELQKTLEAFKKDYEKAASRAGKVETEVKRLHTLIIDINSKKLKTQQDKLDQLNKQIDDCTSSITKAQVAIKTAERNFKKAEEAVNRAKGEIEENKREVEDLTKELKQVEEKGAVVLKECSEAQESLVTVTEEHNRLLQTLKEIQEEQQALQKETLNIRLKLEQIDGHIAEHQSKIKFWQREVSKLSLHPIDKPAAELPKLSEEDLQEIKNPDVINNQIALLEAKCLEMKPNLGSIEEYKKKEELYLRRVAELDEITNERDKFRRAFEDLRKQRLNEFMAGFNMITNKLKENYQMLTLGGDAELELVDSLDPFSEGIMFSVRPPKKSWKKIFNISGGEKTLSSLALVFALHHYKPTPLYFMDEIDAALDFRNVSIVAHYIYEQTKNAQFIIISLRNNMFEIADRLVGIYKTNNTTKSVATNPKVISLQALPEVTSTA
ncbi:structural maintenance of chromosomes protein 4 isoform X2 [Stegostoma tigrinum]|uniref:structural maintenance of chromosomes protein 4 isoform X2 n=1 Tax=Stegostoma tigrinum TaxID=3053191 RepID=UPI00202AC8F5|nr:structural maintenance of chromosomes protein 4 isoform X2 [Stegostoma tigrinum]